MKSETLIQLQQVLGTNVKAESFKRIIHLLEHSTLSVQVDIADLGIGDFEDLALLFLERLRIAFEQMEIMSSDEQAIKKELDFNREKFLNLITDLLKTGLITSREYETALKRPAESGLLWLLNSLRNEARDLLLMIAGTILRAA
jgi:hypothetical protein